MGRTDRQKGTDALWQRLATHYSEERGWVLLSEVKNEVGYTVGRRQRYADGLALNCWRSRGMELHGFEIKVDRGDLLRELKDPSKSDPVQRYCDRWWLVLPDAGLLKPGELPPTWGVLVPHGAGGLQAAVEAPKLTDRAPMDRPFVASILRNFSETYIPRERHVAELHDRDEKIDARVEEELAAKVERATSKLRSELDVLKGTVDRFERASGICLSNGAYNAGRIGEVVNAMMRLGLGDRFQANMLNQAAERFEAAGAAARAAIEALAQFNPSDKREEQAA